MFNFLEEIKKKARKSKLAVDYNVILVSGRLLYIEGHLGLTIISPTLMALKVKGSRLEIEGQELSITELTENTLLIEGNICEVRKGWIEVNLLWKG